MKVCKRRTIRIMATGIFAFSLLISACSPFIPTTSAEDVRADIDAAVQATMAILQTETQINPSPTHTATIPNTVAPSATPIVTATLSPTHTPTETTISPTQTPPETIAQETGSPVKIYAAGDTNCRLGPSRTYKVAGYFKAGESSWVHGTDEGEDWYYIENPSIQGEYCWVWSETTYLEGEVDTVAVVTEPEYGSSNNPTRYGPKVEDYLLINQNGNLTAFCKINNGAKGLIVVDDVSIADITKYKSYCLRQTCGWGYGYPCGWLP